MKDYETFELGDIKLLSGKILKNEERKKFEIHRIKTDVLVADMIAQKK